MRLSCISCIFLTAMAAVLPINVSFSDNLNTQKKTAPHNDSNTLVLPVLDDSPDIRIAVNILTEAYRRIGYRLKLQKMTPAQALKASNSGKIDGELVRIDGIDALYRNLIKIDVPISYLEASALAQKHYEVSKGWHSIMKYKLGVLKGALFSDIRTMGAERVEADSFGELLKMLEKDEVEVALLPRLTAEAELKKYPDSKIRILKPYLEIILLYHYLNRRHAGIAEKITRVLKTMLIDGTVAEIREATLAKTKE